MWHLARDNLREPCIRNQYLLKSGIRKRKTKIKYTYQSRLCMLLTGGIAAISGIQNDGDMIYFNDFKIE